ncbi:ORF6N domain-containing protein [Foetidibacter luteolus]|uniref:ORF6N domain-containing protein n=1 Tax=Foetidibacter luteolus TaxID=2608880 RepID=UPI00129B5FBB|nr:ORF6N domain-containing protein [Foetidibacter luteolus]
MQIQVIQQKIFEIRGQKTMLDFDLAELYGVDTKRLKEAVRRNMLRFPSDFMFQLTKEEFESLRTQFATSNQRGGTRYMPFAFTEQGIAMLSGILNSDKAIKMNIAIMRAFVDVRKFAIQYGDLLEQLKELRERVGNHDAQLNQIYDAIENLLDEKQEQKSWEDRERIGFKK